MRCMRAGEFDVVGALTTVTETFGRVSIHGVRQEILQAQCEAAGLPQRIVPIPYPCPNEIYEARMGEAVAQRRCRRHHPHDLRRSVSRRHPRLSRTEARRHRNHAGVSAVGAADAGVGAGDDRERAGSVSRHRRSEKAAGPNSPAANSMPAIAGRSARWRRSLRRERRVSHLRGGGTDVFAAACGHTANASSATATRIAIWCVE